MRKRAGQHVALVGALLGACALASCGDKPTKAQAKAAEDARLLALPYPPSSGSQPASLGFMYDDATGRTSMTLHLKGLRAGGRRASNVSAVALHLTSSYKGRERARNNPEGSVDGSLVVRTSAQGVLAYSGPPGMVTAGGRTTPLKGPSGKGAYTPAPSGGGEEVVRFRFPTEDLVSAVNSDAFTMAFGGIEIELSGAALSDLREFAARLNPRP